ncbi:ribokinase [Phototrophicus methaneseepsis]|uniref:Ribokinase n=1 Tax=Phototrophicus methaneseepsis TaxID=2710758 RepID=A0A7S8EDB3_9CHLR|nr:bifunctional ADP-heptose synthase [Phototrophicus methaneseepsis]QPC84836.1 ribokinase [Phototrophicus methaneseepsis]
MEVDILKRLIARFEGCNVLVIGDVILDEYIIGDARRMSREAPIPVLELRERRYIPGGAANPAVTLHSLGAGCNLIGVVGEDETHQSLVAALTERGIPSTLLADSARPTIVKTRIMATMGLRFPQQVARVDTIARDPVNGDLQAGILAQLTTSAQYGAVLLSDYQCGLLAESLVQQIAAWCRENDVLLTVDAQGELQKYAGVDLVKCNADEASAYLGHDLATDEDFAQAAQAIYEQLALQEAMVITRGAYGATVYTADGAQHCPSPRVRDVYDTVGAGDTAIAVMTLARVAGATYEQAVMLSNYASGIVVQHVGNYAPSREELLTAITS